MDDPKLFAALRDYLSGLNLNDRLAFLTQLAWSGERSGHGEVHIHMADYVPVLVKCEIITRPDKQSLAQFQNLMQR